MAGKAWDSVWEQNTIKVPQPIWEWDFFGDGYTFRLAIYKEVSWYKRFFTKIFFGSKWKRLLDKTGKKI